MNRLLKLLSVATLVFTGARAYAGDEDPTYTNSVKQLVSKAGETLAVFKQIVTPDNYRALGFKSTNEVNQATNGQHIFVYSITPDKLKAYKASSNPTNLLGRVDRAIVPVMVQSNIRSSMTL